jgi:hypothetical protein
MRVRRPRVQRPHLLLETQLWSGFEPDHNMIHVVFWLGGFGSVVERHGSFIHSWMLSITMVRLTATYKYTMSRQ